jgi:hypothetical protein
MSAASATGSAKAQDVQVRSANCRQRHADNRFAGTRPRDRKLLASNLIRAAKYQSAHRAGSRLLF